MTTKFTISLVFLLATLNAALGQAPSPTCCECPFLYGCDKYCQYYRRLPMCSDPATEPPPAPLDNYDGYSLFSFGDSFADNGNLPSDSDTQDALQRKLYRSQHIPYGNSYGNEDGSFSSPNPTGRFSNYMVQSDFVARMLGLDMAPPPYKQQLGQALDDTGMTIATGGSGVFSVAVEGVPTLSQQVDLFEGLVSANNISPERLAKSVALVAVSGNDYDRVGVAWPKDFGGVSAFTLNVTSAIVSSVERLLALGVPKVLVNNLPPVGCAPSQTKANNHSECDGAGNAAADTHNENLANLLGGKDKEDSVLIVDIHSKFMAIIHGGTEQSGHFKHKYTPYCEAIEGGDFCGDTGVDGSGTRDLYAFGNDALKQYFYWDDMHPTHAGWKVVMKQFEDPIKKFVGVA